MTVFPQIFVFEENLIRFSLRDLYYLLSLIFPLLMYMVLNEGKLNGQ